MIRKTLWTYNVDVSHMVLDDEAKTGLTFVTLKTVNVTLIFISIQERINFCGKMIGWGFFLGQAILHIGSIFLINDSACSATTRVVRFAKKAGFNLVILSKCAFNALEGRITSTWGDRYWRYSGMLYQINRLGKYVKLMTDETMKEIALFASVFSGLPVSKKGVVATFSELQEVPGNIYLIVQLEDI